MPGVDAIGRTGAVVLIDGPSGAGKSTFATRLVANWRGTPRPVLVRMDDIYPGWSGLDAASAHVHEHLLTPRASGAAGRWRRHDWVTGRAAEWHTVPADVALVLEGCGALSRDTAPLADVRFWIDAPVDVRKRRALDRDDGAFDAHWDMWADQVADFERREDPRSLADVVIVNTDGEAEAWIAEALDGRY